MWACDKMAQDHMTKTNLYQKNCLLKQKWLKKNPLYALPTILLPGFNKDIISVLLWACDKWAQDHNFWAPNIYAYIKLIK